MGGRHAVGERRAWRRGEEGVKEGGGREGVLGGEVEASWLAARLGREGWLGWGRG